MPPQPYPDTFNFYQSTEPTAAPDVRPQAPTSIGDSPPFGAGFISLALFFLILFASDILLRHATIENLGILVTLGTLTLLSLVVLILFVF